MNVTHLAKVKNRYIYNNRNQSERFCDLMDGKSGDSGILAIIGINAINLKIFKINIFFIAFMKILSKDLIHRYLRYNKFKINF